MLIENAPDKGQIRVNHEDCPAGADFRKRLYIKRISPTKVVGFCHNCGCKGVAHTGPSLVRRAIEKEIYNPALPADCTKEIPKAFRAYLYKYRFMDLSDFYYSPSLNRLIIPIHINGELVGWAGRSLTQQPKWIYPKGMKKSDKLIVVEQE